MPKSKIALFIDAENLTKWIKEGGPEDLLSDLGLTGQIITRRAYGVWSQQNLVSLQSSLNQLGFELIHNFHPVSGKNSTDIQMTVDIMEHALRLKDVEWFVLATGDSDFSPLFRKLREMGKEVIGVGPKSPLSESVKTSCSRYIYTDITTKTNILDYDAAANLVEKILSNESEPILLGLLKVTLLNTNPAFNEKDLGYSSFLQFINSIDTIKTTKSSFHSDWHAEINNETFTAESSVNTDNKSKSATVETYTRILRGLNWRLVSKDTIIQTHAKLRFAPVSDRNSLTEYLLKELSTHRPDITATEIRKSLAIFTKAGLLVSAPATNKNAWQYIYTAEYRHEIDKEIISRIMSGCSDGNIEFDLSQTKDLLYGVYKTNEKLIDIYNSALIKNNTAI